MAIVCGVTYERAKHEFFPRRRVEDIKDNVTLQVTAQQMMAVIRRLGFSCVSRNGFKEHMCPSIVVFDWRSGGTHAVVWDPSRGCFLDPGYDWPLAHKHYMKNWRRSGYANVVVTGKRR